MPAAQNNRAWPSVHAALDLARGARRASPRLAGVSDEDTDWHVRSAPRGTGSALVRRFGNIEAILPPGVSVLTTEGEEDTISHRGWRHVRWRAGDVARCVSAEQPEYIEELAIEAVVGFVRADCPEHEAWARACVGEEIQRLVRLLRPVGGTPPPPERARRARARVTGLVLDAASLFGESWVSQTLGNWGHLVRPGSAPLGSEESRPVSASWRERLVGGDRVTDLATFLLSRGEHDERYNPSRARRPSRRGSRADSVKGVLTLSEECRFFIDHSSSGTAQAGWEALVDVIDDPGGTDLENLTELARVIVLLNAEIGGDTEAGLVAARRIRRAVVEATKAKRASLRLRASAATVMAQALFLNLRWTDARGWARLGERLAVCDAGAGALPTARRARALHIAATHELVAQGAGDPAELAGLLAAADALVDPTPVADPFDRLGINQLSSQAFFACVYLEQESAAKNWYSHAVAARTGQLRHRVTAPLLVAGLCRVEGDASAAERVEARTREDLQTYGLTRHPRPIGLLRDAR
jgi:hypothetical protein